VLSVEEVDQGKLDVVASDLVYCRQNPAAVVGDRVIVQLHGVLLDVEATVRVGSRSFETR
jgi:hypothetical protein